MVQHRQYIISSGSAKVNTPRCDNRGLESQKYGVTLIRTLYICYKVIVCMCRIPWTYLCSLFNDHGQAAVHLVFLGESFSKLLGTEVGIRGNDGKVDEKEEVGRTSEKGMKEK